MGPISFFCNFCDSPFFMFCKDCNNPICGFCVSFLFDDQCICYECAEDYKINDILINYQ